MHLKARLTHRYREITIAVCAVLALGAHLAVGARSFIDGYWLDAAVTASGALTSDSGLDTSSPVVVIALDQRSLDDARLRKLPRALMQAEWAELISVLTAAGAKSIAFDFLFEYSPQKLFAEWDKSIRPKWDTEFKRAIYRNRKKIILGSASPAVPNSAYTRLLPRKPAGATGQMLILPDVDGIVRRVHLRLARKTAPGPAVPSSSDALSLAGAALTRAGVTVFPDSVLLAPKHHLETQPTYAMIDILTCGELTAENLGDVVKDRVVFVGSALSGEDRLLTSGRFLRQEVMAEREAPTCPPRPLGPSVESVSSVPGVHVHAAAAAAVLKEKVPEPLPRWVTDVLAVTMSAIGAVAALWLSPLLALGLVIALTIFAFVGTVAALGAQIWVPLGTPMGLAFAAGGLAYGVRFIVEERQKLQLKDAFSRYVAPQIAERVLENDEWMKEGGEVRELSVWISDIAGYSTITEQKREQPKEIVALLNQIFGVSNETVEEYGGFVTQYAGDAVVAVFGAFEELEGHAEKSVLCALKAQERVQELSAQLHEKGAPEFAMRFGVATDRMLAGNVGGMKRLNFTIVGDGINLSARLEGANKVYGTKVMVAGTTRALCPEDMLFRHLDRLQVKGRDEALDVYEPLGMKGEVSAEVLERMAEFEATLHRYWAGEFDKAAKSFEALAKYDTAATHFAEVARVYAKDPPGPDWDGVNRLKTK